MKKKLNKDSLERVIQRLEQAKTSGDHFQIKVWSDVLKNIKDKDASDKNKK